VTMNSPASRGANPTNWESVLWHEFCHVVTLHKTRNKMPRWLSEGISVYEEREQERSWGQVMNPQYRELILAGGATPVSKLSSAFLHPPTPMHLQFAYYESSMVVQFVVEQFGAEALRQVLAELGESVAINEALARHTEPIGKLDESFAQWLKGRAEGLGKDVDWERPKLDLDAGSGAMRSWVDSRPNSFWGWLGYGRALVAERKFKDAVEPLNKAASLYPTYGEPGGPWVLLAGVYRQLGDGKAERDMLEKHVALNAEAVEPRIRLMELAAGEKDWKAVGETASQLLGINPLIAAPHKYVAMAAEALGDRAKAIEARRTLLMLDPLDKADHHYRLAKLLAEDNQLPAAKREVLQALEDAPRFRDAHQLLLELVDKPPAAPAPTPPSSDAAPVPTEEPQP
jgi:tetratricopeptide (TPR) repeat protein